MNNQQILERLSYALRNVELLAAFQEYDHLDAAIQICGEDFRLGEDSIEWLDYDELLAATGDFFAFSNGHDDYDYCGYSSFYVSSALPANITIYAGFMPKSTVAAIRKTLM